MRLFRLVEAKVLGIENLKGTVSVGVTVGIL